MAATYDPNLSTNRDHVRFLVGDTDITNALLSDEEIQAVIGFETATGEALPFYAAASLLSALRTRWASSGRGIVEKQVGRLRIKRGVDGSATDALEARICELRERGAWLSRGASRVFRVL